MLGKDDEKKIEKIVLHTVIDALEQVVLPRMDKMETDISEMKGDISEMKGDISEMKGDIENLDNRLSKAERKMDVVIDHQADRIDNHEKRIGKLELTAAV